MEKILSSNDEYIKIKSEFPSNMHICILCPNYLQIFKKFCAAVKLKGAALTNCSVHIHNSINSKNKIRNP